MGDAGNIDKIIEDLKSNDGISEVVVVSRSGMHIAGDIPQGAHLETFVAMSAILLGAAETATSELKEDLSEVLINLSNAVLMVHSAGPKALIVAELKSMENIKDVISIVKAATEKLKDEI